MDKVFIWMSHGDYTNHFASPVTYNRLYVQDVQECTKWYVQYVQVVPLYFVHTNITPSAIVAYVTFFEGVFQKKLYNPSKT